MIVGVLMIAVINIIGTYFSGKVVVMLPFEPFSLIQGITHRNIPGTNFYESAYLFPYILVGFVWRNNIKKIFGKNILIKVSNPQNQQYHSSNPHNTKLNDDCI